jgi:hypothetical protein
MKVGFRLSLIEFHKKVSIPKINIGSKDAKYCIDEGLGWVSGDIL